MRYAWLLSLLLPSAAFTQAPAHGVPLVEVAYPQRVTLLSPRQVIRAEDPPEPAGLTPIQRAGLRHDRTFNNMVGVRLDVIINWNGRVESVRATQGPSRFYAQAEDIVRHSEYAPFRSNGQIVRAHFTESISVLPPERWSDHPLNFPAHPDLNTLSISLERTSCYGSCPSYKVTLDGSGLITFQSQDGAQVATPGRHTARVDPKILLALLERFRAARFFSADDKYECGWTDLPGETLTLSLNGQTKTVYDYGGAIVGLPAAIDELEPAIDDAAATSRWVAGNDQTLPALRAEHWDFAANTAENMSFFNSAIKRGNAQLVEAFLTAQAPVATPDNQGIAPICTASGTGNYQLVARMLPPQRPVPLSAEQSMQCLSLAARIGSMDVARLWLDRGAPVNLPPPASEDAPHPSSPLLSAIQGGHADLVGLILDHHASLAPDSNNGRALLSFATQFTGGDNSVARTAILQRLLDAGASATQQTETDEPPLFYAGPFPSSVPLLVAAGADPNQRDEDGQTPLIRNAYYPDAIGALLHAGADPALADKHQRTALTVAQQYACNQCVAMLKAALHMETPTASAAEPDYFAASAF
jgi:ankyrin repeat protein